jgi:hypothetical protein
MRHPQACGAIHYLDDSLLDDYSFPMKKLDHKTISHFLEWLTLEGTKIICAAKKTPNKIS